MSSPWRSIPNWLSALRLLGTPALFPLVRLESPAPFLAWYAVLALTDFLDGFLARRWHETTELGAMLDSVADIAFYLATAAVVWIRFPQYVRPNLAWLAAAVAMLVVLIAYTRLRFGRVLLPHTHLSRAAGILAVVAALAAFATDATLLLRGVILLYAIAFVEQIAMFARFGAVPLDTRSYFSIKPPRT